MLRLFVFWQALVFAGKYEYNDINESMLYMEDAAVKPMEGKTAGKKERNLGIELMRIICLLMIMSNHIICHGWVIQSVHAGTWKHEILNVIRTVTPAGMFGFTLISGYVGVHGRFRYSSLVLQWLRMWVFSVFFTVLAAVLVPGSVSGEEWKMSLFPTLHSLFWYYSAYLGCSMIMPMVRMAMRRIGFRAASAHMIIVLLMVAVLPCIFDTDAFLVGPWQGAMWLLLMYLTGAYFGWFKPHERMKMPVLWAFAIVSAMLLAGTDLVAQRLGIGWIQRGTAGYNTRLVLASLSMLLLFTRLKVRCCRKLITWLGGASFGVYVLHEHPQIRKYTISKHAYRLAYLGNVEIVIGVVLCAAVLYVACAIVDSLRQKIFDALRLRQKLDALETKLIGDPWADC